MASIQNIERLISKLRARAADAIKDSNLMVVVGYNSKAALFVHENMEPKTLGLHKERPSGIGWYWGPSDYGPKFLEGPARELAPELGAMVRRAMQQKQTLAQSLLQAGLRLQAESQKRVPIEFGDLHASAFTLLETT